MKISALKVNEPDRFCIIPGVKPVNRKNLERLWDERVSKPEWCFVAEFDGEVKGRAGFMLGENDKDFHMFALLLPNFDDSGSEIPRQFLTETFHMMKEKGAATIGYHLDSDIENHQKKLELLKSCGMEVIQTKKSFILEKKDYHRQKEKRLVFKTLPEVGKDEFLKAFAAVSEDTLDRDDELSYKSLGSRKAAENHFTLLENLGDREDTWYLAYKDETLAGMVIPQKFDDQCGAINYIGVIPSQRGNNYVSDLLDTGISNLVERNVQEIIADIDDRNFPMENSLTKIGFREENRIWVLRLKLQEFPYN